MSRGQKVLALTVFVVGLIPLFFGRVTTLVVGCLYAFLAAFFTGAFWGINDYEGVTKYLWFFKMFGLVFLPISGFTLMTVFLIGESPVWSLSGIFQISFVVAGMLILTVLGLAKYTKDDELRMVIVREREGLEKPALGLEDLNRKLDGELLEDEGS